MTITTIQQIGVTGAGVINTTETNIVNAGSAAADRNATTGTIVQSGQIIGTEGTRGGAMANTINSTERAYGKLTPS